jgi:hypothetical protein
MGGNPVALLDDERQVQDVRVKTSEDEDVREDQNCVGLTPSADVGYPPALNQITPAISPTSSAPARLRHE